MQLYLQPFVAVGDYTNIRQLARPRSYEFSPSDPLHNPDFNDKSLRGNLVLRWEYRAGARSSSSGTCRRSDESRPGVFSPLRDLADTFGGERYPRVHDQTELLAQSLTRFRSPSTFELDRKQRGCAATTSCSAEDFLRGPSREGTSLLRDPRGSMVVFLLAGIVLSER